ncbi:nucleotidyltransferase family protein [Flavobacterium cellulosilyticum]|uniref:MobA-like NTP transferase domain-containing protein n=1 Tax=Flavobacterium cellulosilyticum TaxID=2541731 RepID=A0A4R5CKK6_9FLAO|nr:NTP transferase domain-containing protein [Flavobacterium cellulosilyticum]TDD99726.1 hypothetical protein E0F76_03110 [Flavobacterium cellulosilyticum]
MENNSVFVLLAGGKSERMGVPKGLLAYKNTFWILEQLNRITNTAITEVYIGLGFQFEDYFEAIPFLAKAQNQFEAFENLQIKVVLNKNPEAGSFSTLQSVLVHIPKSKSVLIQPVDIPILNRTELQKIIESQNTVVQPNYNGKNGHPIKLSSLFWNPLLAIVCKNENARLDFQIKKTNPEQRTKIEVQDSCCIQNLNSPDDWLVYKNTTK